MNEQQNRGVEPQQNTGGCLPIFIIGIALIIIIGIFKCGRSSKEGVHNSSWDNSVEQVEKYLRHNLNDPSSYEPIDWSLVNEDGDSYWVRHRYRATNGFGSKVVCDQIFFLDSEGNVTSVSDYEE